MLFKQLILSLIILTLSSSAMARIKLVALPDREVTQVNLDNSQATLVEEQRTLTLQKGINRVDFSWKGVQIQPDSIRLTILKHPDSTTLLNVNFPPNSQSLIWEIYSPKAQQEKIKISYLLNRIDRVITYEGKTTKKEDKLEMSSFLVLRNFSGESFDLARFQLDKALGFDKEIQDGQTKRVLLKIQQDLAIKKVFEFDAGKLPWEPDKQQQNVGIPVYYELENTIANQLGKHALWAGKFRVFQQDSTHNSIFLGEDQAAFTPVDQTMALYIGDSRDVVVTQRKTASEKLRLRRNNKNRIVLYDNRETMQVVIENFKDNPALLRIIEPMQGEWQIDKSSHPYKRRHSTQLEYEINIPPGKTVTVEYTYTIHNIRS